MRRTRIAAIAALLVCGTCLTGCAGNLSTGKVTMNAAIDKANPSATDLGQVAGVSIEVDGLKSGWVFAPFKLVGVAIDGAVFVGGKLVAALAPVPIPVGG